MGRQQIKQEQELEEKNPAASFKNWKTLSKFVVFGVLTCEAIKMIAIRSVNSEDVAAVSLGFLGSLVLLCISALLKSALTISRLSKQGLLKNLSL